MDIYITEKDSGTRVALAALPENIEKKGSANQQSYDIIETGEVKLPRGEKLLTFSWNGFFPGASRRKLSFVKSHHWRSPKEMETIFDRWRKKGTILVLMVTETSINHEVTLTSFSSEYSGGLGDIQYSVTFTQHKNLRVFTTKELNIKTGTKKSTSGSSSRPSPSSKKTYTVVKGDNLWKIAEKHLGAGKRWTEIYNLNKEAIEKTAKSRGLKSSNGGHWIFPGQKLTLPG